MTTASTDNEQIRHAEQHLTALIIEGLESGLATPADRDYWENKRHALAQRHGGK